MDRRKLIQYLLLNIFVSASVTGGILFWYDRNYRAVSQPAVAQQPAINAASASSLELQTDIPVKISSVIGAGNLAAEVVVIKFEGEGRKRQHRYFPANYTVSKRSCAGTHRLRDGQYH
ncbi:MAG TPA: hypothetical protein PLF42_01045 [Anaerolineales bacterium]|nr:hypothetical protein [Anaerolineales bacterium]